MVGVVYIGRLQFFFVKGFDGRVERIGLVAVQG